MTTQTRITIETKLSPAKVRRLGSERGGERTSSPRPAESLQLTVGGYCLSRTGKWQGVAKVLHIYSGIQAGWLVVRAADGLHIPRVEYVTPVNHVDQPGEMVAPCRALMVVEQPRQKPDWRNFKSLTTPDVIALYPFNSGTTVEYKPGHIGTVKRVQFDLVWIVGEMGHFPAKQVTPIRPDPDVCTTCYGDCSMGHTFVDEHTHLGNYACPSCGGTGKKVVK